MKKFLSIIIAMAVMLSSFAIGTTVFAQDEISVQCSVFDSGVFTQTPTNVSVTADLSDEYADLIGYNDNSSQPTVLDCAIATSINMFGSDFMEYAPLKLSSSGWFISAFGEETASISYRVNGKLQIGSEYVNIETAVSDGDYVEFMFYQDTYYYSDAYTYFNTREEYSSIGETVKLTLYAETYDENWQTVSTPAQGVTIAVNDNEYGVTDENGEIAILVDSDNTLYVTATGEYNDCAIFSPYCTIYSSNKTLTYVNQQIANSANLLYCNTNFDTTNAVDFLTYLTAGQTNSDIETAFVISVLQNLQENDGKLLNSNGYEDLGLYGAVIQILNLLNYNPQSFNGYDLVSAFESLDANQISNPYYYRVAIEATNNYDFAISLCDQYIKDYYVYNKGMNYYGYSCDNTAYFITSLAKYESHYKKYIENAKTLLKSYTTSNGAFYNSAYGTNANADSTATALMAYSALGDTTTAFTYYKALVKNFEGSTGSFGYVDTNYDAYATKDALVALEYFSVAIANAQYEHPEHIYKLVETKKATTKNDGYKKYSCSVCNNTYNQAIAKIESVTLSTTSYTYNGSAKKPTVTVKDSKGNKIASSNYTVKYTNNKNVGKATVKITFKGNYSGTITKTFKINPKATTISKLTATSKGFKATWKKQTTQTTGYQIRYSTKSSMSNAKTVTVSKNSTTSKTISKLTAKKKYYVQIRTYKTVNGTKYYSTWSKAKTVTTKK